MTKEILEICFLQTDRQTDRQTGYSASKSEFEVFIEELDEVFSKYTDKNAVDYMLESGDSIRFKYSDIYLHIKKFSNVLESLGINAGDRVAIITPHSPYGIITGFSLAYHNCLSVLIDASLPTEEIERLLKFADVRAVFTTDLIEKKIKTLGKRIPFVKIDKADLSYPVYEGYSKISMAAATVDPDYDCIAMLFSSGTTSSMKGVLITYSSVIKARDIFVELSGLEHDMSYLLVLPFNHIAGFTGAMTYILYGCTIGLIENVNASRLSKGLLEFNPSYFAMVPRVYDVMVNKVQDKLKKKGCIDSALFNLGLDICGWLRKRFGLKIGRKIYKSVIEQLFGKNIYGIGTGAGAVSKETASFFINMGLEWANLYATTEAGVPIAATGIYDRYPVGTVGNVRRNNGIDVKVINKDEQGKGEICVKTPLIMKGYFREPELTREAFIDGYFKTGDLGYIDSKGYLYITGRGKECIILRNGKKISPADLDKIYQPAMPAGVIIACCGVPVRGKEYDEIWIFIEKGSECDLGEREINKIIFEISKRQGENYKIKKHLYVDKIPMTTVGKVKRFVLKEMALESDVSKKDDLYEETDTRTSLYPVKKSLFDKMFFVKYAIISRILWNFEVEGLENIPDDGNYIVCPNHQTHLDGFWAWLAMGKKRPKLDSICCLAKIEHLETKSSRKWMHLLGGIPVDRTGNTAPAVRCAIRCLKEDKFLLIHPEGTRTRSGVLGDFKEGAAYVSKCSGRPILPVRITGAYDVFPYDIDRPRVKKDNGGKYTIGIEFLPILHPLDRSIGDITEDLRNIIANNNTDIIYLHQNELMWNRSKQIENDNSVHEGDWLWQLVSKYCEGIAISEESSLVEDLGIDSLSMFEIITEVYNKTGVDLSNQLEKTITYGELKSKILMGGN